MSDLVTHRNFDLNDTPSLRDKVTVCTGGNSGLGREIVFHLLAHDISKVYVLARSLKKFQDAIAYWKETHMADVESRVEFVECDLGDKTAVKKTADELMQKLERQFGSYENMSAAYERLFSLTPEYRNHLRHEQSTAAQYGNTMIVITSLSFHLACQELKFDLIMSPTRIKYPVQVNSWWRYARSKLGTILFTKELSHCLHKRGSSNVYTNCFFPRNVPTAAMDSWKDLFGTLAGETIKSLFKVIGQSPADAAATDLYLAASPEVESKWQKGKHFILIAREQSTSKLAEDKNLGKNLWYWCDDKVTQALGRDWAES